MKGITLNLWEEAKIESSALVSDLLIPNRKRSSWSAVIKNEWSLTTLLILISAIPTLALWNHSTYLTGDSYQYLRAALTFSQGQGLRDMSGKPFSFMSPLYPVIVGMVHRLVPVGNIETTARLVSFVGASVAVVAFYRLLRGRYGEWVSFSAAFLFALLPLRLWSGLWILSEGLFLGLLMLSLAAFFAVPKRSGFTTVLGGILLGLAYLSRPEALLCVALVAIFFWFNRSTGKKKTLLLLSGFLSIALPYHAWVYQVSGVASSGRLSLLFAQSESFHQGLGPQFVYTHQVDQTGSVAPQRAVDSSLRTVVIRYLFFARWEVNRLIYGLGPYWIVLTLLVIGAIGLMARSTRLLATFAFNDTWQLVLLPILLVLPFLHIEDRYFLQTLPVFVLWLVLIVADVHKLLSAKLPERWKTIAAPIPLSFVALFTLAYVSRLATQIPHRDSSTLARGTSRWLESQNLAPPSILSQNPDLAFFSGAQHLWMPNGEAEHVLRYAQRNGARYIYVSSQDVPTPLNDILLGNDKAVPASLRLLHEEIDGSTRGRLFELKSNEVVSSHLHL